MYRSIILSFLILSSLSGKDFLDGGRIEAWPEAQADIESFLWNTFGSTTSKAFSAFNDDISNESWTEHLVERVQILKSEAPKDSKTSEFLDRVFVEILADRPTHWAIVPYQIIRFDLEDDHVWIIQCAWEWKEIALRLPKELRPNDIQDNHLIHIAIWAYRESDFQKLGFVRCM